MEESLEKPLLSVVVIGRNEGDRLSECLKSVRHMHPYGKVCELIYVDSASQDDSVLRAQQSGAHVLEIQEKTLGAAYARNMGWKTARGEFVLFLDGDSTLHSNFVHQAIQEFKNPNIGVVSGMINEKYPDRSIFHKMVDLDWNPPSAEANYCGGNALIRRSVLEKVGGYNPHLIAGEEPEMCQRIKKAGFSIIQLNTPMVSHDLNMTTFSQYWARHLRTGYAYASISHLFSGTETPLWKWEAKHNLTKGFLFFLCLATTLFLSWVFSSTVPLTLFFTLLVTLICRTALHARKKGVSWSTSLLYGLHSHFQHIPMFFGQLNFWINHLLRNQRQRQ